jgi:hypothetical protein
LQTHQAKQVLAMQPVISHARSPIPADRLFFTALFFGLYTGFQPTAVAQGSRSIASSLLADPTTTRLDISLTAGGTINGY